MNIVDITLGTYELPLFEIRAMELLRLRKTYGHLIAFQINESRYTFSGKPKPMYFTQRLLESHPRHYVIHGQKMYGDPWDHFRDVTTVNDITFPEGNTAWEAEHATRNIAWGYADPWAEYALFGDMDEIPCADAVATVLRVAPQRRISLNQYLYYWTPTTRVSQQWHGTRGIPLTPESRAIAGQKIRESAYQSTTDQQGWHYSYFGSYPDVVRKIESYAHQEYNNPETLRDVEMNRLKRIDPFGRDYQITNDPTNCMMPEYLRDNFQYFMSLWGNV